MEFPESGGEALPPLGMRSGNGWSRLGGCLRAAVGFFAISGWEFLEEEAGACDDVLYISGGIDSCGELQAGGVLDGEAIEVKGVSGNRFFVGQAEAFVGGLLLLGGDVCEGGDRVAKGGAIGRYPAFGLEVTAVFESCGVSEPSTGNGGSERFRVGFADLEFGTEDGVLAREGKAGTAACSGSEALHFTEVLGLLDGELGECPGLATLGSAVFGQGGDLSREGSDKCRSEALGHGTLVGRIGKGLS